MKKRKRMLLSADKILKMLPHRYPFLLLDGVTELVPGKYASGIKNVTISEMYFAGHFIDRPVMPGVLMIESLAQLTAIMYATRDMELCSMTDEEMQRVALKVGYLTEIKNVKFIDPVRPGDVLTLKVWEKMRFGNMLQIKIEASVDDKCVLKGCIAVSEQLNEGGNVYGS